MSERIEAELRKFNAMLPDMFQRMRRMEALEESIKTELSEVKKLLQEIKDRR